MKLSGSHTTNICSYSTESFRQLNPHYSPLTRYPMQGHMTCWQVKDFGKEPLPTPEGKETVKWFRTVLEVTSSEGYSDSCWLLDIASGILIQLIHYLTNPLVAACYKAEVAWFRVPWQVPELNIHKLTQSARCHSRFERMRQPWTEPAAPFLGMLSELSTTEE